MFLIGAREDGRLIASRPDRPGQVLCVQLGAPDEFRRILVDQIQDAHKFGSSSATNWS